MFGIRYKCDFGVAKAWKERRQGWEFLSIYSQEFKYFSVLLPNPLERSFRAVQVYWYYTEIANRQELQNILQPRMPLACRALPSAPFFALQLVSLSSMPGIF